MQVSHEKRNLCGAALELPQTRKLTEREQTVLVGIVEGLANKQIAERRLVSESSVEAT